MTKKAEVIAILKLSGDNVIEVVRKKLPPKKMGETGPVELSAEYKIFISSEQTAEEQTITIIHELLHIVESMAGDGTSLSDPEDYDVLSYYIYGLCSGKIKF